MSELLIDLGNTRIKWMLRHNGQLDPMQAQVHQGDSASLLELEAWLQGQRPTAVFCCSVAGQEFDGYLSSFSRQHWDLEPVFAVSKSSQGRLRNAYKEPPDLGVDRWLAMVGAANLCGGAFTVIDAGTAVTVDAVAAEGQHLGGWIIPGRRLMQSSLAGGTAKVQPPPLDFARQWGHDTPGCVAAGIGAALGGAVMLAERLLNPQHQLSIPTFLCGGDAPWLRRWIAGVVHEQPDLVLRGLALVT